MVVSFQNRMVDHVVVRGDRIRHGAVDVQLYEPGCLPPERFGSCLIIVSYDDGRHAIVERLGVGTGCAIGRIARIRAGTWHGNVPGRVRIGVADVGWVRRTR